MAIAAELLAAYAATDFVVFDGLEQWALHVGVASPRRSRHHRDGLQSAQPRVEAGVERGAPRRAGAAAGAARAAVPLWRRPRLERSVETECIVFGISLAEGLEIARRFEQNAVVFIERGKAPRLEFPEE